MSQRFQIACAVGPLLFGGLVCAQNVLWENGEWDQSSNVSSERNTVVSESWAVDDVSFGSDVEIQRYRWTVILLDGWGGATPLVLISSC